MKFITKSLLFVSLFILSVVPMLSLTGCAQSDLITYSKDARRDGLALYKEGNYTEAAASFQNATRQEPRDYQSYFDLGCCYDHMKQYQLSILAYRNALESMTVTANGQQETSFRLEVLDALAWSTAQSTSHQNETAALERKANSGTNPEDFFLLAKIYRYTGDVDAALDAYNRCTLLAPREFVYVKEYGMYLMKLAQNDKAAVALRRANQIREDDKEVLAAMSLLGVNPAPSAGTTADVGTIPSKGPASDWDYSHNGTRPTPGRVSNNGRVLLP